MAVTEDPRHRTVGELVGELSEEVSTLLRREVELATANLRHEVEEARQFVARDVEVAKEELAGKGRQGGRAGGMLGGAGVAALLALGAATTCVVMLLDRVMPNWVAALIVTIAWAVVGLLLLRAGRKALRDMGSPMPERAVALFKQDIQRTASGARTDIQESIESIKEDLEWAKTASGSART